MRIIKLATTVSLFAIALPAAADQVILDDVIVDGSLCVGFDCVNGESFGFDTIRLKENNMRIHFQDTSTSASFPTNDWRIVANDTSNGGASYLGIEDSSAGRIPFRVEAGARANALFVEDSGDIGIGTANPVADVHVVTGNTPTLRLDQDGSSGFSPQIWDVAGNEAGFFIRDATNGSTLPFRILPGAASQSLVIDGNDEVGIGAGTNPTASLHVRRTDNSAKVLIEDTSATGGNVNTLHLLRPSGNPIMRYEGSFKTWDVTGGNIFSINDAGAAGTELTLSSTGDLTILGEITTSGSCSGGCDRVFSPDYDLPSIEDHSEAMWRNSYLPMIGPTPEGQPINLTDKTERMLNELEKAHIYIDQLHDRLEVLEAKMDGPVAVVE